MARYIDAEKARIYVSDFVCEELNKIPSADVVEVKHGEWILKHIGAGHYWECSECEFKNAVMPRTNFCPNCGAKTDGAKEIKK